MIHRLVLEPITAAAFAPFGDLLLPRPAGQDRHDLIEELRNTRPRARPRLSFATVAPTALPFAPVKMERHVHSAQVFVPLDCASYLVLVAPQGKDGLPDMAGLRAFRVPGDAGINYRADTWHHGLSVLERVARFAILTFVDGTAADEEVASLPAPVAIEA